MTVAPQQPGELRVLVVDDDLALTTFLAVERADLRVAQVVRAGEVASSVRGAQPDAVVVDRWLPDGDGLDVVRRLRRWVQTRQVPVVVARTGPAPDGDEAAVLRAGADADIPKPLDSAVLAETLHRLLLVPPGDLRARRQRHLEQLKAGEPTPGLADLPLPTAETARRRWWRRGD
jgi:CheY-like chemotaxis protein